MNACYQEVFLGEFLFKTFNQNFVSLLPIDMENYKNAVLGYIFQKDNKSEPIEVKINTYEEEKQSLQ